MTPLGASLKTPHMLPTRIRQMRAGAVAVAVAGESALACDGNTALRAVVEHIKSPSPAHGSLGTAWGRRPTTKASRGSLDGICTISTMVPRRLALVLTPNSRSNHGAEDNHPS